MNRIRRTTTGLAAGLAAAVTLTVLTAAPAHASEECAIDVQWSTSTAATFDPCAVVVPPYVPPVPGDPESCVTPCLETKDPVSDDSVPVPRAATDEAPLAGVGCTSHGCTGKDPQEMGCAADAKTLAHFVDDPQGWVYIELRHSSRCNAAWTRISVSRSAPVTLCNVTFGQIRAYDRYDTFQFSKGRQCDEGTRRWTQMISFTWYVRACVAEWFDGRPEKCTRRY